MGILFFCVHFLIEVTSFYIVSGYTDSALFWLIALLYDYFAFVPQGLFGHISDVFPKIRFAYCGVILSVASLFAFRLGLYPFAVITVLAIGNAMIHVEGAERTLRSSDGKMTPAAVFVSGGSFGVICGKLAYAYNVPFALIVVLDLSILVFLFIAEKRKGTVNEGRLSGYDLSNKKIKSASVVALAVLVVAVRAYMGYGVPTSWNKTEIQTVLLYCSMGVGKALGGILTDRIGIKKTVLLSTVGALPFLVFGDKVMAVSLIGIMLFSMTMAVTLGIIVSKMKTRPGVAFGLTTVGLFAGTLPIFFFRSTSLYVNVVTVTILTALSAFILLKIIKPEESKK